MLSLDVRNLPNLEEFKIKEDKSQVPFEKTKNEADTERKESGNQVASEESKINLHSNIVTGDSPLISATPTLLAWSSYQTNKISIIDLETNQNYITFDGASISDTEFGWTHVKEIPGTKLLVSLQHNEDKSANMEIFDISKKGKANKIYSLGEVFGGQINCVRWSPNGDMLSSASNDGTAKLLDFKTGKVLYTGTTSDEEWSTSVCFI